jgi:hypothetical protein
MIQFSYGQKPMLILSLCTHCQAEHELSPKLLGDTINCLQCSQPFVVVQTVNKDDPILVQSVFAAEAALDEPLATAAVPTSAMKSRMKKDEKHSLIVPPPPKEKWSPELADSDDVEGRFPEFRPHSAEVRRFVDRAKNSQDYSWLLAVGLFAATLMVMTFLVWFIYLLLHR